MSIETLSDKEEECFCHNAACKRRKYRAPDVKQFIKDLKEEFRNVDDCGVLINDKIDKLAGEKLI